MKKTKINRTSKMAGRKRVQFQFKGDPGSDIYVSGSFNNWNGKAKKMIDKNLTGDYSLTLFLQPGRFEYKFILDGEWHVDPECPDWVVNDCGTLNSVLNVNP